MSQSQRRGARGGAEPTVSTHRRERDVNSERLVFVLAGLVGHRVTAKLRNNVTYEGVFHGCSMEDFSITLKSAQRLNSVGPDNGEVVSVLVIPGKDFLLISADDVSCKGAPELDDATGPQSTAFATDSEISQKKVAGDSHRELVPWAPSPGEVHGDEGALGTHSNGQWDQFQMNEEKFGITTTYNEELYTTKLDPKSISREKREQADRIAREIESGAMAAEAESALNGEDGDEEAKFSAIPGTGYYRRKDAEVLQLRRKTEPSGQGSSQANGTEGDELSSQVPLTKETLVQHESLTGVPEGDALKSEHRRQRGIITAQTPLRNPMISEMKRINALNLEPALPKLDDKTRNDWISFKQSQSRNSSSPVQGDSLKMEFQQSLEQIQKREASRKQELAAKQEREADFGGGATSSAAQVASSPSGKSGFSFNPQAKEFNFNPQAATFTPTNAGGMAPSFSPTNAGGGMQASPSAMANVKPTSQAPPFIVNAANDMLVRKHLLELLDPFFDRSSRESADHAELVWPDASGPSFQEVLGQPNPANPMPPVGAIQGGGMPWQQQQQQQAPGQMPPTGPAPGGQQMMGQPGMMMPQQGAPGGQPGQMYQPMYPAPPGGVPQQQRPPNGNVQMQGQQGPMVFHNQPQTMMQQQPSMMPAGMVQVQQGQPGVNMGAVPKFPGQVLMNPVMGPGQFQQGFQQVQQPGQPGGPPGPQGVPRPGPHGPQPGGPPQGQMMQQPMYHQQMAPAGAPHQMTGHEG